MSDILDEYIALKHPERTEKLYDACTSINEKFKKEHGMDVLEFVEKGQENLDERFAEHYQSFIKEGASFTGADIRYWKKQDNANKLNGQQTKGQALNKRRIALKAFLEIDHQGGTSTEAIELALKNISMEFPNSPASKNSIQNWLKDILPLTNIQKQKKGRPAKK